MSLLLMLRSDFGMTVLSATNKDRIMIYVLLLWFSSSDMQSYPADGIPLFYP